MTAQPFPRSRRLAAHVRWVRVVGVEAGALNDRVPPELGALVPVDEAPAMARAIADVTARRESLGRAARRHAEDRFSWNKTFRDLLGGYTEVLGRD